MISLSRFSFRFFTFTALIVLFLSSCNFQKPPLVPLWPGWTYMDLRSMDPVDSIDPNMEIVALYTRQARGEIQIRLDFLELNQETKFELFLAFDTHPGGNSSFVGTQFGSDMKWDVLISSDSNEHLETYIAQPMLRIDRLRILRDPEEDTTIISFTSDTFHTIIENQTSVFAWIRPPGGKEPVDSIGPVKFSARPPEQANVVLYFWNTFAAATPAQALRRWDGAHSGPDSSRHGLNHLLSAVELTQVPVILSDLNTPQNLSALDYLGVLDRVRQLAKTSLISMPDISIIDTSDQPVFNVPEWVYEKGLMWNRQVSQQFMVPGTQTLVARQWPLSLSFPRQYRFIYPAQVPPLSRARICYYGQTRVLCQVESADDQALADPYSQIDEKGFTVSARRQLVAAAFSGDGSILFMGGDFGFSAWGIQGLPAKALGYLRSHPWIRVLSLNDLQSLDAFPDSVKLALPNSPGLSSPFVPLAAAGQAILSGLNTEEIHARLLNKLKSLPDNKLTDAIWQWYFGLLSANSKEQHRLNAATLGQIGHLLAGAKWAEEPYSLADCGLDLDWDGENECVLSSDKFFASFEVQGGALVIGLLRSSDGVQQFIAPTYQVYSGISDPFLWKTDEGFAGDPDAISGAFIERAKSYSCCLVGDVKDNSIEFVMQDMTMRKKYFLSDSYLEVSYQTPTVTIVSGLLVNDPWNRFFSQWANSYPSAAVLAETPYLDLGDIRISTNAELTKSIFTSSQEYLAYPEDPNFDYTAGHYLLFPFGGFTITGSNEFWIRVEWSK